MKHNKKKNIGLIYEFLLRAVSDGLVNGDESKSSKALNLVNEHFKPGSELYKEFRLMNSLVKTTVSGPTVASSIMSEVKTAARTRNTRLLEAQRDKLVAAIDKKLKDEDFYDRHIGDYKAYATVHMLFNEWRKNSSNVNISNLAIHEDFLNEWLITEKKEEVQPTPGSETPGSDRLVMKVMTKKLNEKYGDSLGPTQRALMKSYVFASAKDDQKIILDRISEIKSNLLGIFNNKNLTGQLGIYVEQKLDDVLKQLIAEDTTCIDDEKVTRFMLYSKLHDELLSKEP
jgi:hypothetical protein